MESPALLITGAAGFLGAEVVRRARASGRSVHALARSTTDRSPLAGLELSWHTADLEDRAAITRAFTEAHRAAGGLDVIHLAARISYRRQDRALLQRTNVDGTRNVLEAARAVGARRVCHVSSVVALGPVRDPSASLDDDAPLAGRALDSAYASTKAEAELLALEAAAELDLVVASPAVVFGASGERSNSTHFLERVRRGTLGPLCPPGSLSVVGLEDAADGILRVLAHGRRARRYLLSESAWTLRDLLRLASRLVGRPGPRAAVPPSAWSALVAGARAWNRLRPSERATPEALALLGMHFRFEARRARSELGWGPRSFEDVLRQVLAARCGA